MQARPFPPAALSCRLPHPHRHPCPCFPVDRVRGVSLVELLTALAVVAVFAGLALPGMRLLVRAHQVRTVSQILLADLNWAQAEAVRHGIPTALAIRTPAQCGPGSATGQRRCGWTIFLDRNGNAVQDNGDTVLRQYQVPSSVDLPSTSPDVMVFAPQDSPAKRMLHLEIAPAGAPADDPAARVLCMGLGTRIRLASGSTCTD